MILKIEVSLSQPLGTPIFKPWERSKIRGKRPVIRWLTSDYGPEQHSGIQQESVTVFIAHSAYCSA